MDPFKDYQITSPFGYRQHPVTGNRHFHTGIDLVKYHRAPITAFVGGQVVHAREGRVGTGFGGFGNVVAIRDKYGCLHCYVHLDSISVAVGEVVNQGDEIGKQGDTGSYTTGSHLHYEVRKKASPSFGWIASEEERCFDPTQYLLQYYVKEGKDVMSSDLQDHITQQEKTIVQLEKRINALESLQSMSVPDWAQEAVAAAVKAGVVDTPEGGSFDFYRIITVMYRKGLFN